jgi:hypothetical protein
MFEAAPGVSGAVFSFAPCNAQEHSEEDWLAGPDLMAANNAESTE